MGYMVEYPISMTERSRSFDNAMKYVFLFDSVHRVIKAEKLLKGKGIKVDLIPVPREINSDCGVAVEVDAGVSEKALLLLEESKTGVLGCYTKDSSGKFEERRQAFSIEKE
jgi:hypothetical protein